MPREEFVAFLTTKLCVQDYGCCDVEWMVTALSLRRDFTLLQLVATFMSVSLIYNLRLLYVFPINFVICKLRREQCDW